jgi:hypothetical protein
MADLDVSSMHMDLNSNDFKVRFPHPPSSAHSHQMDMNFADVFPDIFPDVFPDIQQGPPLQGPGLAPPAGFSGAGDDSIGDNSAFQPIPIFDINLHNQSTTSFASTNTGGTGTAPRTYTSSLSIPEGIAAQLASFDLRSGLSPVYETLKYVPVPPLASQESFCRQFPVWKKHLTPILDVAISLVYHYEDVVPLDEEDINLIPVMTRYTPRAVLMIVEADRRAGGSFGKDGAGKHISGPIHIVTSI